ncbi:hypothetical protein ACFQPF_14185 [Fictibacillus iocasae]|uniref:Uncharacterized protein n=1 Tax=Fictibacillus iocasae TaxID=2715437 RepID=A0ABW2NU93_9BACL
MKTQTMDRIHLLIQELNKVTEKNTADEETWTTITEISRLLEEDVEIGSRTQGVVADIGELGEDFLKKESEERERLLPERMDEIVEYATHLKEEAERSGV